ncbi:alpha/beta hydrolase [Caballeronia sp. LZ032]|uniref:alpha/beta fold hydrolase n=1 Tax=Caballeronia sp. LZ032 TaxID=3038565 RepID=UPI00286322C2|nr:alpha/beta hydrolase [Caballeronia sp. LZ032]MDR5883553.1 alpha/beta hydrolase [Caballeronia sp. LZ032]
MKPHRVRAAWPSWRIVAGVGVCALSAWAAVEWARLKRTPALSDESARAGITVRYTQAGPYRMFSRRAACAGGHAKRLPVVLVHGLVISSRYMEPLALALREDFDVHAPDLPGFGESALHGHTLSVPELADALRLWLGARGIERAMFVGNSFGCQILADFAARYPEAVDRLVLQGPTVDRDARWLLAQIHRDWHNGRMEQARSSAAIGRIDYAKAGILRAIMTMRALMRDRIERKLSRIAAPTLVVAGSRDPVAPLAWAGEVAARLPNGALLTIDGGTHTLNYVYPHSFALAIRPFLLQGGAST